MKLIAADVFIASLGSSDVALLKLASDAPVSPGSCPNLGCRDVGQLAVG